MKIYDVSSYQADKIYLRDLKDADGFIIKAGNGDDITSQDEKGCAEFVKQAKALGKPYGLYLFCYAIGNETTFTAHIQSEIKHMQRLYAAYGGTLGVWLDIEEEKNYKQANGWYDYQHPDLLNKAVLMWLDAFANGGIYSDRSHKGYLNIPNNKWWAATLDGTKLTDCVMCQYSEDPLDTNVTGKYFDDFTGKKTSAASVTTNAVKMVNYTVKVLSTNGVNLRSGAGTQNKILTAVPNGKQLKVSKEAANGGYTWGYVTYNNKQGWIALDYCKKVTATTATIKKGSTVKVKNGAKDYSSGLAFDTFVYKTKFTVMELSGSRAVIGINGKVTAAVDTKYLTLA